MGTGPLGELSRAFHDLRGIAPASKAVKPKLALSVAGVAVERGPGGVDGGAGVGLGPFLGDRRDLAEVRRFSRLDRRPLEALPSSHPRGADSTEEVNGSRHGDLLCDA
jgi:hypothetical protein